MRKSLLLNAIGATVVAFGLLMAHSIPTVQAGPVTVKFNPSDLEIVKGGEEQVTVSVTKVIETQLETVALTVLLYDVDIGPDNLIAIPPAIATPRGCAFGNPCTWMVTFTFVCTPDNEVRALGDIGGTDESETGIAIQLTASAFADSFGFGMVSCVQPTPTPTDTPKPTDTPTPTGPPTKTPCPDGKIVKGEQPNAFCGTPTPVTPEPRGGIAVPLDADDLPLETAQSSGHNAGVLAGTIAGAALVAVVAVGGAAWYTYRRRLR